MRDVQVAVTRFTPAPPADRARGLCGWASIVLDDLWRVEGVAVRKTAAGRLAVFFPERIDQSGQRHRIIWPLAPWARRHVEREVLRQLAERAAHHERVVAS